VFLFVRFLCTNKENEQTKTKNNAKILQMTKKLKITSIKLLPQKFLNNSKTIYTKNEILNFTKKGIFLILSNLNSMIKNFLGGLI